MSLVSVRPLRMLADLLERLGQVPLQRIRFHPPPGTAIEQDVLEIAAREDRLCELVDGESILAMYIGSMLGNFVRSRTLGQVTGEAGMVRLFPGLIRIPDVAYIAALMVTLLVAVDEAHAAERPNVVIVMTDDQGYGDLSCHGNPVLQTPHIDRLFAESIRLTDYHVSPTCSPTRAALMTGHWSNRTGVWHTIMGRSMLREDEVTMGQVFQDAGYATGMFGKWHLGDNYPYRPEDRGFTEVVRHGGGGVGQTPDYWDNAYFDGTYWHNGEPTPVKGFCTDVFFDSAIDFIERQSSSGKPFLAYIATNAPHGPMHAPMDAARPYQEQGTEVANFFGMISNIDDNVGRLRGYLREAGLEQNTIFIFTTDNGSSSGWPLYNSGMRGGKGSAYDGGHRVPLFLRWPEGGFDTPRDVRPITAHVDILPTLMEMCQIADRPELRFDGRSLLALLRGDEASWPQRVLITDSQRVKDPIRWRQSAVMTDRWRLINGSELYDIDADPGQRRDVAAEHPAEVARLRGAYEAWWSDIEPSFERETAIYLGHPAENPARLTSHDWITTALTPWNQAQVRAGFNGEENTGYWNVNVVEDGTYTIRLRRWPEAADAAITAPLGAGADVPGVEPYRATPGRPIAATSAHLSVGDVTQQADVLPDARFVEFRLPLRAGRTRLAAWFETAEGEVFGAYYVDVKK